MGEAQAPLRHAYYLFLSGPDDACAACYIPLLLTAEPLTAADVTDAELIITYERDSIWAIRERAGTISDVALAARTLKLDGKPYRYQEVALEEATRLLRNPLGTIPIARPKLPDSPTESRVRAFLLRLGVRE